MRVNEQIKFDRATIGLSQEDVQIARQLQRIYENNVPLALASSEAAAMRVNNQLRQMSYIGNTAASGFLKDLASGVRPMDAFERAARGAAEAVLDIATKKLA